MKHGIVIPCCSDSAELSVEACTQFLKKTTKYEICFVDAGCSENFRNTLNQIKRISNTDNIYIYQLNEDTDKCEAIRKGFQFLLSNSILKTVGFIEPEQLQFERSPLINIINSFEKKIKLQITQTKNDAKALTRDLVSKLITSNLSTSHTTF